MEHGRNKLKHLFCERTLEQIVVPEIQRDYVWGEEHVRNLISSILADFAKEMNRVGKIEKLQALEPELREMVLRSLEREKPYSNIGFIYAYKDRELSTTYFLIDGQQRITTIFLINLFLAVREAKQTYFERYYFVEGNPKLDYRVRENAQDFIRCFIRHILDGSPLDSVIDQSWYHQEYELDVTIRSILSNYGVISEALADAPLTLDYMETHVEFWFFDTDKSFQGENLYLYMNSRGEMVRGNENLKAALMEPLPEAEKLHWGSLWEDWQDFFWKRRGGKANADAGFDEFLRWVLVLAEIPNSKETNVALLKKIGRIKIAQKFPSEAFSLVQLQQYHEALERLVNYKEIFQEDLQILTGETKFLDYYRLLPCLYVAVELPTISDENLYRVVHFFYNTGKLEDVSESIELRLIRALELVTLLLAEPVFDIAHAANFADKGSFGGVLTDEEVFKFKVYLQASPDERLALEKAFWAAEDLKLMYGQIDFIFDCMEVSIDEDQETAFEILLFQRRKTSLRKLIAADADLLRRALLTKGDYTLWDGNTTSLQSTRYSLLNPRSSWRYLWRQPRQRAMLKSLVLDFDLRLHSGAGLDGNGILKGIIADFLASEVVCEAWRRLVIEKPEILAYTLENLFCGKSDDLEEVYALQRTRATLGTYQSFAEFV